MEKTVSVKTESDTVKVAVITQQNKIVTQPDDASNLQIKQALTTTTKRTPSTRFNAHAEH